MPRRTRCSCSPLPFRYNDKGMLATIGRAAAVAQIGRMQIWGFLAWLIWALVHIWFLIGFRNRLVVMLEWAWAYVSFSRNARVILDHGAFPPPAPVTAAVPAPVVPEAEPQAPAPETVARG